MGLEPTDGAKPSGLEFSVVSNSKRKDTEQTLICWELIGTTVHIAATRVRARHHLITFILQKRLYLRALRKTPSIISANYYFQLESQSIACCHLKTGIRQYHCVVFANYCCSFNSSW